MTLKTRAGIILPDLPDSLTEFATFREDVIYTIREKSFDAVFMSWYQRCRKLDPNVRVAIEDPAELSRLIRESRAAQQAQGDIKLSVDDSINIEKTRDLLIKAATLGASDIHVLLRDGFTDIHVRIKGYLKVLDRLPAQDGRLLERTLFQGFASTKDASFNPGEFQNAQINGDDVHPSLTGIRLVRGPAYPSDKGGGFVVGRLQYKSLTAKSNVHFTKLPEPDSPDKNDLRLDSLGYSVAQLQQLRDMAEFNSGIIIVTGPTGSGKTTLIYELLKHHAATFPYLRQITIEDPIEYPMPWAVQMAITNASNEDATADAFAERLRTALRMDPDVMLLGEIRGAGSALSALNAAMTGHLVLGTLHTTDPYMTIDRLELMDPVRLNRKITCDHRLVLGMVAQRLLPRLCPQCKVPFNPDGARKNFVSNLACWGAVESTYERGPGCEHCGGDGYIGRFAVGEVVRTDPDFMREAIVEGTDAARKSMRYRKDFTGSVLYNAMRAVFDGIVSPADVHLAATLVPPGGDA
jgi:type II secretory ATPase GspE/PulE/Tfp pilus assembly ATPase PilB-like protein